MSIKKIKDILISAKKIGITYHVSPDGDAVGSVLALYNGLKCLNKNCYIISKEAVSENLKFLLGSEEITGEISEPTEDTDVVIVLDCGNYERICANLDNYNKVLLNVDHHLSNDMYGNENYVDTNASATAEIVYDLLLELGFDFSEDDEISKEIGTCLYTSLVTDTGAFRHSNVTYKTLEIASKLKKIGVDNTFIYQSLFDNKDFNRVRFIGKVLTRMQLVCNGKVALIELPKDIGEEYGLEVGDTSDIISYGLQIKGVEVTLLIKEADDKIKASLRSKNDVDVRKVAECFGGGGHTKAAGLAIKYSTLEEARNKILSKIEEEL